MVPPSRSSGIETAAMTGQQHLYKNIHFLAFLAIVIRLVAVFASDFINHPDELFQYLEQAHRLEFGYGIIPWEYRFGARSWALPSFLSSLLHIFRILHLDNPRMYIPAIKSFFAVLSVSMVYASSTIVKRFASERAGLVAAWIACFWYELIYFAGRATPEVVSAYCVVTALALAVSRQGFIHIAGIGFLCACSLALRLQYLPLVLVVLSFALFNANRRNRALMAAVFLGTAGLAGFLDYVTWGGFFASYYYSYLYNVVYRISWIFGKKPGLYYVTSLLLSSAGFFLMVLFASLVPATLKKTWLLLLCALAVIVPHSLLAHKEDRFIFAAIPFLCMLSAVVLTDGLAGIAKRLPLGRIIPVCTLAAFFAISLAAFQERFMTRDESLSAYLFLHDEHDLAAVHLENLSWDTSGGFYYLHRDVPIYYQGQLARIAPEDYRMIVSHILCRHDSPAVPGFFPVYRTGDLEIRKVAIPPHHYRSLNLDRYNVPGIDAAFKPMVRRLL
jgi:GPI mannosyltransferase 3